MVGFEVNQWWKFCWTFMAPFFIMVRFCVFVYFLIFLFIHSLYQFIIVFGLVNYEPLEYNNYKYPMWVNIMGMLVAASSVLCIPVTALWLIARTPGTLKEVKGGLVSRFFKF